MTLPKNFMELIKEYPQIGDDFRKLSDACYEAGPLDRKTAHLIKLGMAIASHSEGAAHTQVRRAKESGASDEEIRHVVILSLTTLGWPMMGAAWSWIQDVL